VVTPDTILGWYRKLVARKCDGQRMRWLQAAGPRAAADEGRSGGASVDDGGQQSLLGLDPSARSLAPSLLSRSRLTVEAPRFHPETPTPAERCVRFGRNGAEIQSVANRRHDSFLPTPVWLGFSRRETSSNPRLADHGWVLAQYALVQNVLVRGCQRTEPSMLQTKGSGTLGAPLRLDYAPVNYCLTFTYNHSDRLKPSPRRKMDGYPGRIWAWSGGARSHIGAMESLARKVHIDQPRF
jgi:hypothetical protein